MVRFIASQATWPSMLNMWMGVLVGFGDGLATDRVPHLCWRRPLLFVQPRQLLRSAPRVAPALHRSWLG
eukprot:611071-Rhodomonas_salina.1